MIDGELKERVRELRGRGLSPKEIARTIGVRPSAIADVIRAVAAERDATTPDTELARCWVSPGWSVGLSIDEARGWPDTASAVAMGGLVTALVAHGQRHRRSIEVCVFLVDVYCLGVKNALGPERTDDRDLPGFVRQIFGGYELPPVPAPIDLVRAVVYGAVEYARALGFDAHPDFARARARLGPARVRARSVSASTASRRSCRVRTTIRRASSARSNARSARTASGSRLRSIWMTSSSRAERATRDSP